MNTRRALALSMGLLMLLALLSGCSLVSGDDADDNEIYAAYADVVSEREAEYGAGLSTPDASGSGICWMHGVACVRLWDLDEDGVDELLLWENTLVDGFPSAATIEVWTYRDGAAQALYRGAPRVGGDPSGQSLELLSLDGETMLVTGFAGGELELEYYALRGGVMEKTHILTQDASSPNVFYYDGSTISSDDAQRFLESANSLCNACAMSQADADAILRETDRTRDTLGL